MNTLLLDAAIICFAALLVFFIIRIARRDDLADAMRKLKSERRVRIAFYVVVFYFTVGFLDCIKFPGSAMHEESLVDLAFSWTIQERTYSSPFAATITGIEKQEKDAEINRVKGIHVFGTDRNGHDVLKNILKGCKTALLLSFGTNFISFPIGLLLGILAGFFGGRIDDFIQWLYTTVASIPWLLFVIAFLIIFGRGIFWICLALGLTEWVGLCRLIRGETMKNKNLDYIAAARASGIPVRRILGAHLMPNLMHLVIISFTLSSSSIILAESILTYIGIGVEPGTTSWGVMLIEAQRELMRTPPIWWVFAASSFLGILPLVLSLNIFGDALRDVLDPKLRSAYGSS